VGVPVGVQEVEFLVLPPGVAVWGRASPKPRLDWVDRAVFAALVRALSAMPRGITGSPPGTVLRWRRRLAVQK
jgi:putative transposase